MTTPVEPTAKAPEDAHGTPTAEPAATTATEPTVTPATQPVADSSDKSASTTPSTEPAASTRVEPAAPPAEPSPSASTAPKTSPSAGPPPVPDWAGDPDGDGDLNFVWTYRGYQLRASEFVTAMVHFFRAEISRANVWRQRLDTTTNWAVLTTGAAISFAFNNSRAEDHGVIILNTLLVTIFLFMEARRYRYYELWSYRVRLMETDFFAAMLVPPFRPAADWAESLAENLLCPTFPISMWEAFGRRFRNNYFWIYMLLGMAWVLKVWLHPVPAVSFGDFLQHATIGTVPGWVVLMAGIVYQMGLFTIGLLTMRLQKASGEVLPRYGATEPTSLVGEQDQSGTDEGPVSVRAWFRQSKRRSQLLTYIITDRAEIVAERILRELRRGVTALPGKGMYTGKEHSVLMVALTVTEVPQLEALVRAADPRAFVIMSPVQEIFGSGFVPLEESRTGE